MTQSNHIRNIVTSVSAAAILAGGSLFAGDYGKVVIDDKAPVEAWSPCDIFEYGTLYKGDGFIRKVSLNGRYHGQAVSQNERITDPAGNTIRNGYHEWQHRRFRIGANIAFAGNVTLKTSTNISDGSGGGHGLTRDEFFNDWDEFYLDWEPEHYSDAKAPAKNFVLKYVELGKQKQTITREFSTTSRKILTVERSPIVNEVADQKPWGVTIGFEFGGIDHEIGGWLLGAGPNGGLNNWPDSRSRGGASYNFSVELSDATELFFDYVYVNNSDGLVNGGRAQNNYQANYEHTFAIGTESEWGRLGLITDFIIGVNREREGDSPWAVERDIPAGNDTWGLVIMPYYDITDKLQAVFKYSYMSEGEQQRTQRFASGVPGDTNYDFYRLNVENYHTIYAGLNYYVCDHNLKVMAGYEYATGDLYGVAGSVESGTWMLALRTYF